MASSARDAGYHDACILSRPALLTSTSYLPCDPTFATIMSHDFILNSLLQ
jgi:hypothetical protein